MPKFVVGLTLEEFSVLADYFTTFEPMGDSYEESIIYGIISQLVSDYDDREPEYIHE